MTADGPHTNKLSVTQLQRIDSICAKYEADFDNAADSQARSPIEAYLNGFDGLERSELLRELLALDLELRGQRGETPQQTDYAHLNGAGDQTVVRSVFDSTVITHSGESSKPSSKPSLELGTHVGPYVLVRCLGEGGMGTVYLAEQKEPIERQVALKVVKSELGSQKIVARFQQERQALAAMDHPNVAKVLDAGAHEDNTPYFVMELVDGLPISHYCEQQELTIEERLRLFLQVCYGVQHAHQKGIIHRDLKPSNVLVADYDGKPMPKVIDFGLATAIRDGVIRDKSQTDVGTVMGTFQYMSPEQADSGNADVDTRSDVYSLGVLLYELLTGRTPLSRDEIDSGSYFEILQQIRETEPAAPSSVASSPRIPRELDWISLRALAKNRDERYETATALAEDIHRFLNDEPVVVGPPSATYRLAKFVRRNQILVAAAAVATASLVAGLVVAGFGLASARDSNSKLTDANAALQTTVTDLDNQLRITREARAAETKAREEEAKAREAEMKANAQALLDAETTEAVNRFLSSILRAASPHRLGREATVREALDFASKNIATEFPDRPRVKMAILASLASTYADLGEFPEAEVHARGAVKLYSDTVGPKHSATLRSMDQLATILMARGQFGEAVEIMQEVCHGMREEFGMEDRATLIVHNNLATMLARQNKTDDAVAILEEVLEGKRKLLGDSDDSTLSTWANLASMQVRRGKKQTALEAVQKVLKLVREKHGERHHMSIATLGQLAFIQSFIDAKEAIPTYEQLVELKSDVFGENHPETLKTVISLSTSMLGAGDAAGAEPHLRRIVRWNLEEAPNRGAKLSAELYLVQALAAQGKGEEAETLSRKYVEHYEKKYPAEDLRVIESNAHLGLSLLTREQYQAAEKVLGDCFMSLREQRRVPPDLMGMIQANLGIALVNLGRTKQGKPLVEAGLSLLSRTKGKHHILTVQVSDALKSLAEESKPVSPDQSDQE